MVAKKTAAQQSASGRSTRASGGAAKDLSGKKSTQGGAAGRAAKAVKTVRGVTGAAKPPGGGSDPAVAGAADLGKTGAGDARAGKKSAGKGTGRGTGRAAGRDAAVQTKEAEAPPARKADAGRPARKATAEEGAAGKASAGKGAAGKTRAGKASAGKARAGKGAEGKASAGEGAVGKASAGEGDVGKASARMARAGKGAAGKASAGKASTGKVSVRSGPAAKRKAEVAKQDAAAAPTGGKAAVRKTAARKTVVGKAVSAEGAGEATGPVRGVGEAGVTRDTAKKDTADKGTHKKSAAKKSSAKKAGAAQAAEQTGATTVVAKKTPGTATAAKTAVPKARLSAVEPGELAVRPGEDPWTEEEVEEARDELLSEATRLRDEITSSEQSLVGLMRDSGDGAGDDQADTGAKNITREHEMALAANAREMLDQTERALDRLDAGTYGLCENCGNPIGKARMQAFPRATLCVECKQKQERR